MNTVQDFGLDTHRSGTGALLGSEVARIANFLRFGGLLIAEHMGGSILAHPQTQALAELPLSSLGLRKVLIGASINDLESTVDLAIGEIRALEMLTPGPLIIAKEGGDASPSLVAVPDSPDLRDICAALGGTATAYRRVDGGGIVTLDDLLGALNMASGRPLNLAALRTSVVGGLDQLEPTVVRISGPGRIESLTEGVITLQEVEKASVVKSQWEIGDWT